MPAFAICPSCGDLDVRRTQCHKCGHEESDTAPGRFASGGSRALPARPTVIRVAIGIMIAQLVFGLGRYIYLGLNLSDQPELAEVGPVFYAVVGICVFGFLTAVLAGVATGRHSVRVLYAVLALLGLPLVAKQVIESMKHQPVDAAITAGGAVVTLIVLYLLFSHEGNAWYERCRGVAR